MLALRHQRRDLTLRLLSQLGQFLLQVPYPLARLQVLALPFGPHLAYLLLFTRHFGPRLLQFLPLSLKLHLKIGLGALQGANLCTGILPGRVQCALLVGSFGLQGLLFLEDGGDLGGKGGFSLFETCTLTLALLGHFGL